MLLFFSFLVFFIAKIKTLTNQPNRPPNNQIASHPANRPARKLAIKPVRANLFDFFPDRFLVFSSNSDYYYYVRVLLTHFFVKPEPLETMRRTEQKKSKNNSDRFLFSFGFRKKFSLIIILKTLAYTHTLVKTLKRIKWNFF